MVQPSQGGQISPLCGGDVFWHIYPRRRGQQRKLRILEKREVSVARWPRHSISWSCLWLCCWGWRLPVCGDRRPPRWTLRSSGQCEDVWYDQWDLDRVGTPQHPCLLCGLRHIWKHNCGGGRIQIQPYRQTIEDDTDDQIFSSAGDLAETTIINTNTGSNTVVAPLNTLRHGAYMTNLHNLVVAFGGWNTETSAPLTDLEIWNPNDNTWNNGPGQVFHTGRLKFGMVTLSFPPGTCELETSYQEFSLNTRNVLYYGWIHNHSMK